MLFRRIVAMLTALNLITEPEEASVQYGRLAPGHGSSIDLNDRQLCIVEN